MKKIIYILLSVFALSVTLNSCVEDTDYETPQITCTFTAADDVGGTETTMQSIIDVWIAANDSNGDGDLDDYYDTHNVLVSWDNENTNYISGYVISDDRTGNFYKELYLQNDPTNPTVSLKLGLDMRDLFTKYNVGRKVFVKLKGLALNQSHGELMLGQMINSELDEMMESTILSNVFRNCEAVDVTPVVIGSPADINVSNLGMLVQFDNMQFDDSLLNKTYVDPAQSYDTQRAITNVSDGSVILLETSSFANFGLNILNPNRGSVKGILARDYSDSNYVLRVNGPDAFIFDQERYNPNYVFIEDFESYASNDTDLTGWTNINVSGGSTLFQVKEYSNQKYIQCSAYSTNENPLEAWLVTPAINLDNTTEEMLSFRSKTGYNNGAALSVYIATDFTGDVSTTTWVALNPTIADGPSSGYGEFVGSGNVDISSYSGNIHIAFKYLGGDGGVTTTFQIDDIAVIGN